jgi:polyhydroxyalkanoate synthesis regulator phasin
VTNRNLSLIKELDIKIEKLKHTLVNNPKMDTEKHRKIANDIISLSHEKVGNLDEKIQIANQLEKNVELSIGDLNKHIGNMIKKLEAEHQGKQKDNIGMYKQGSIRYDLTQNRRHKPRPNKNQDYELKEQEEVDIYCLCKSIKEGQMIECEDKSVKSFFSLISSVVSFGSISHVSAFTKSPMGNGSAQNVQKNPKTRIINLKNFL